MTWQEVVECFDVDQWQLPIVFPSPYSAVSAREYVEYLLQLNGISVYALEKELGLPRSALHNIGGEDVTALRLYDAFVAIGCPWHWNDFADAWRHFYRMDPNGETWPDPDLYDDGGKSSRRCGCIRRGWNRPSSPSELAATPAPSRTWRRAATTLSWKRS